MHTPVVAEEEGVWPTVGKEAADLRSIRGEELTTCTRSNQEATFDFFFNSDEVKIIKTQVWSVPITLRRREPCTYI
jgi:hypothetical protein